jgi:hypothetical protein
MARGGGVSIGMLSIAGVGILVLAIVFMLAPTIPEEVRKRLKYRKAGLSGVRGGQMETAMPALGASSNWNSTYNTGLKTGPDVWEQLSPFLIDSCKSLNHGFTGWIGRARYPGSNHHLCPPGSLWRRIDVPV